MKYCPHCGSEHPEDARFCPNCGAPLNQNFGPTPPPPPIPPVPPCEPAKNKYDSFALTGMILGIIGLVCVGSLTFGIPCSVLAIIFSAIAKKHSRGGGKATAGLVTGIIGVALTILTILWCVLYMGTFFWMFAFCI